MQSTGHDRLSGATASRDGNAADVQVDGAEEEGGFDHFLDSKPYMWRVV